MNLSEVFFPYSFSHTKRSKFVTDLHEHAPAELFYMQRGKVECTLPSKQDLAANKTDGFTTHILAPGQFILVCPHQIHRFKILTESEYYMCELGTATTAPQIESFFDLIRHDRLLSKIPNSNLLTSPKNYYIFSDTNDIKNSFISFIELLGKKNNIQHDYFLAKYELSLYNLLFKLCENINNSIKFDNGNKHLNKAISYINENYTKNISVQKIADYVGISVTRLHTIFKESYNHSVSFFIKKCRLELAAKLLYTDLPIKSIAQQIGYNSLRSFEYAFFDYYGEKPSVYRKTHQSFIKEEKSSKSILYTKQHPLP